MNVYLERFEGDARRIAEYISKKDHCSIFRSARDTSVFGNTNSAKLPEGMHDVHTFELIDQKGQLHEIVGYVEEGENKKVWKRDHKLRSIILGRMIYGIMKRKRITPEKLAERTGLQAWQIELVTQGRYRLYSEEFYLIISALDCRLEIVDNK